MANDNWFALVLDGTIVAVASTHDMIRAITSYSRLYRNGITVECIQPKIALYQRVPCSACSGLGTKLEIAPEPGDDES